MSEGHEARMVPLQEQNQRGRRMRGQRGYVLIIVMGLLAILGVMSLSLRAATRTSYAQTRRFQDAIATEFLAKAAIDWVIHYVNTLARQDILWQAPWLDHEATFRARKLGSGTFDIRYREASGVMRYGLQDEEARLNINTADAATLAALPGLDHDTAQAIVAQRQQERWRTAEALVQQGLITADAWYGSAEATGLEADLTAWGSGKININTASPRVLAALPGSTPALVEALIRYRQGEDQQLGTADDRRFQALPEAAVVPEMEREAWERVKALLTVTPSAFRFVAIGRSAQRMESAQAHQRFAVLEREANTTLLRYWRKVE